VSRLFTRFQDEGLLNVERKHIQLLDIPRLQQILNGEQGNVREQQIT